MGLLDIIVPPYELKVDLSSPSAKNISAVPYINICKESTTSRHEVMKLPHFGPIILVTIASGCACRGGTWGSLPGRRSCLVPSFEGLNYYPPGK